MGDEGLLGVKLQADLCQPSRCHGFEVVEGIKDEVEDGLSLQQVLGFCVSEAHTASLPFRSLLVGCLLRLYGERRTVPPFRVSTLHDIRSVLYVGFHMSAAWLRLANQARNRSLLGLPPVSRTDNQRRQVLPDGLP